LAPVVTFTVPPPVALPVPVVVDIEPAVGEVDRAARVGRQVDGSVAVQVAPPAGGGGTSSERSLSPRG
jgi:hypothetical protein